MNSVKLEIVQTLVYSLVILNRLEIVFSKDMGLSARIDCTIL